MSLQFNYLEITRSILFGTTWIIVTTAGINESRKTENIHWIVKRNEFETYILLIFLAVGMSLSLVIWQCMPVEVVTLASVWVDPSHHIDYWVACFNLLYFLDRIKLNFQNLLKFNAMSQIMPRWSREHLPKIVIQRCFVISKSIKISTSFLLLVQSSV